MDMHTPLRSMPNLVGPLTLDLGAGGRVRVSEIATTSPHKLREYQASGLQLEGVRLDLSGKIVAEPQVNDDQLRRLAAGEFRQVGGEIALGKAVEAFQVLGRPVLIEDVSLGVFAAPTFTGPNIKLAGAVVDGDSQRTYRDLCFLATVHNDRRAVAVASLAVFDGERGKVWQYSVEGMVPDAPRGSAGFGWDCIFVPEPQQQMLHSDGSVPQTWAEMEFEQKIRRFPLRGGAVQKLADAVLSTESH